MPFAGLLPTLAALTVIAIATAAGAVVMGRAARRRGLDRWLAPYLVQRARRLVQPARPADSPIHVLLCIADHYEPQWGRPDPDTARQRVESWVRDYPRLFGRFRDADGRPPRHTFFFPIDEYDPDHVEALAGLCRDGYGEVEIHLHHDGDTPDALRDRLETFKARFASRHGVLPRHRQTGELAYGFVHGNWALDNARPDGRWCGVNNELDILRQTGCYADFTLPAAPDPCQTRTINRIYYAVDDPQRPRSHDRGFPIGTAPAPENGLLLIQGPLVLDGRRRKWGLVPRIENGCLQGTQPPSIDRLDAWLKAGVQVPNRPDWFFVKLHTHGAPEHNQRVLLGPPMVRFHEDLARRSARDPRFHFHYVTARELYNLARAAEAGWTGTVAEARDFELVWNPDDSDQADVLPAAASRFQPIPTGSNPAERNR